MANNSPCGKEFGVSRPKDRKRRRGLSQLHRQESLFRIGTRSVFAGAFPGAVGAFPGPFPCGSPEFVDGEESIAVGVNPVEPVAKEFRSLIA